MKLQRQLSNAGWIDEDREDEFIARAVKRDAEIAHYAKREPKTEQEIRDILATGKALSYGTDWYEQIRDADARRKPKPRPRDYPNGRRLDCGCTVYYQVGIMNASMGSSCEGCYDRMS